MTRAQHLIDRIDEVATAAVLGAAALSTAGQQLLAKKRREEKVRAAGHGDELDAVKKKRLDHEKKHTGKLLVGKKAKQFKQTRSDLKSQHQKVVNKGLAGHAKLFSQAGRKGQEQMAVR